MATVLTTVGTNWIRDRCTDASALKANKIGWGTGAGTAAVGDTTLFTEASEARVTGTETAPSNGKMQWVGTLTANAGKTITNAGNFDAATAGNLVVHGDFAGIVLATNDQIQFTISITVT